MSSIWGSFVLEEGKVSIVQSDRWVVDWATTIESVPAVAVEPTWDAVRTLEPPTARPLQFRKLSFHFGTPSCRLFGVIRLAHTYSAALLVIHSPDKHSHAYWPSKLQAASPDLWGSLLWWRALQSLLYLICKFSPTKVEFQFPRWLEMGFGWGLPP